LLNLKEKPFVLIRRRSSVLRFMLFPAIFGLFFSCASFPSASVPRAAVPEALNPQWQSLARGIDYFAGKVRRPRLELWAFRVDLYDPALDVVVSKSAPGFQAGHMPSTKVTGFVKRYNCVLGINANPFSPVSGKEGEDREIAGITLSGGVQIAPPDPRYDALVFYRGGGAQILSQALLENPEQPQHIADAVGGFFILLWEGALPGRLEGGREQSRHPRSAAGLSADGRTLYLLVIDGRRPGSAGATEAETGLILKRLGAFTGLNFDGGGSSALALRRPDGKVRTVNTPIHGGIPGRERGVASCLGIRTAGGF
jgi:hypothetical protein